MSTLAGRLAGLVATALLLIAALGALSDDLQGSARVVLVTAVVGALAPLFWPGRAATTRSTAMRIAGWSFAATVLAAALAALGGNAAMLAPRIARACIVLLLVLVVAHALAAVLEALLQRRAARPATAREASAWLTTAALAAVAATPLWLGPAAELASKTHPRAVDVVVAVSPLTHLAVASGNDLLRNQWFYQHSNLSGLRFEYPPPGTAIAAGLALLAALLAIHALLPTRPATAAPGGRTHPTEEQRP
jgi:hypothetical protein